MSKLYEIIFVCYLWLWLGLPVAVLEYVTYFRFCGRRHTFSHNWPHSIIWLFLQRCCCSVVSGRQNTPLYLLTVVTFNQNRCIQNSHETVNAYWHCRILWEAGSMKRYGDHTSVPFARCSSMLQVCCCGPGRYIDRLLQQWRANAGSATLTAYDLNADLFGFTGISLIRI